MLLFFVFVFAAGRVASYFFHLDLFSQFPHDMIYDIYQSILHFLLCKGGHRKYE